jgi:hypothetical protein
MKDTNNGCNQAVMFLLFLLIAVVLLLIFLVRLGGQTLDCYSILLEARRLKIPFDFYACLRGYK